MKINLAELVKIQNPRKRKVEARPFSITKASENELARLYIEVLNIWAKGLNSEVLPEYRRTIDRLETQDSAAQMETILARLEGNAVAAILIFRSRLAAWLNKLNTRHLKQFINQLKYASNVDLSTAMRAADVAETLEDVIARNAALVRNVSDQARGRIADIVYRGMQNRTPPRQVAKQLNEALKLGRDRSLRIAQDQATKLAGALDKERQLQVGMDSFEWIHSGKKHPREEHKARNGKVFKWNSEVGRNDPPGYAINCGCKAKGVLQL